MIPVLDRVRARDAELPCQPLGAIKKLYLSSLTATELLKSLAKFLSVMPSTCSNSRSATKKLSPSSLFEAELLMKALEAAGEYIR